MKAKFKVGDYFFYRYTGDYNSWMICKIIRITPPPRGGMISNKYYRYKVIKASETSITERIGSASSFGVDSGFHSQCLKIDSPDDSHLLAVVL